MVKEGNEGQVLVLQWRRKKVKLYGTTMELEKALELDILGLSDDR